LKALELNTLKGAIGEHLARSFIRNTLAQRLVEEEKWDHVVFSRNNYKQSLKVFNERLFSYDRFREDFFVHGFCADRQLLSKYGMVVGVLARGHCTPDGLLLKLQDTGYQRRVGRDVRLSNVRLRSRRSVKRNEVSKLPVVKGDLEIVEIKCGRSAKLMKKQKETYDDLLWKGIAIRMVEVRIVSFDRNKFLVQERKFEKSIYHEQVFVKSVCLIIELPHYKEMQGTFMKKRYILGILIVTVVLVPSSIMLVLLNDRPINSTPMHYTYSIVNVYPHDKYAFTQGLIFVNGVLYESTGLYGNSSLRSVELETGNILQLYALPNQYFGEGITIFNNKIIQLTWRSNKGFLYDIHSFDLLQEFGYPTEGWGITNDGNRLIMSDGTATLYFLDPVTFEKVVEVEVHDDGPVTELNELEYIQGEVYANIWKEEKIAIINPQTGQVNGWIDLSGIENPETQDTNNVLNGIAYDAEEDRLFVTGKRWPQLFEIRLIPLD